jgi:hypothetical protein
MAGPETEPAGRAQFGPVTPVWETSNAEEEWMGVYDNTPLDEELGGCAGSPQV